MSKRENNKKQEIKNFIKTNDKEDDNSLSENNKVNAANERKLILLDNVKTFIKSAEIIYNTKDFTSASTLYFKALFSILDLIIFQNKGKIPKDHSERFRILEADYGSFYLILDKLYPDYRNSYNSKINKQTCDKVKENVERIVKEQKIFKDN